VIARPHVPSGVHNPCAPHLLHATSAHPILHAGWHMCGMQKVGRTGFVHPGRCVGSLRAPSVTLLAEWEGWHHLPGSSMSLHDAPPLPSSCDVLGLCVAPFMRPLCVCMGAGRKDEGGPFLWGPVCMAPPHTKGGRGTSVLPVCLLLFLWPFPSHTPVPLGGAQMGVQALPLLARLSWSMLVCAPSSQSHPPQTSWIAQGKLGRGLHGKGHVWFPSSAGCPVLCAQGGKGVKMGAVPSLHPIRWAGRGQQGRVAPSPTWHPPPCLLSANTGVRAGKGVPPHLCAPLACTACKRQGWCGVLAFQCPVGAWGSCARPVLFD
jgi:hypothetical protein